MNEWIERYIYDVARRLPENERVDVKRELEANINDMLPDNPAERDIADTLAKLGPPRVLAERYRQTPRYLISPAMFELYISVLKTVTVIVAVICLCVGAFTAVLSGAAANEVASAAISMGIGGVWQALFWVTFGFAIADHVGYKQKPWTVASLPRLPDSKGVRIPSRRSITGIVLCVFFTALLITLIMNGTRFYIIARGVEMINPFTQTTLHKFIPYILLLGCLGVVMNCLKLYWGRWNLPLCAANIVHNILWVSIVIYVLYWPDLFSNEFIAFTSTLNGDADILRFTQSGGAVLFLSAVFVLAALVDAATSIRYTWKGGKDKK